MYRHLLCHSVHDVVNVSVYEMNIFSSIRFAFVWHFFFYIFSLLLLLSIHIFIGKSWRLLISLFRLQQRTYWMNRENDEIETENVETKRENEWDRNVQMKCRKGCKSDFKGINSCGICTRTFSKLISNHSLWSMKIAFYLVISPSFSYHRNENSAKRKSVCWVETINTQKYKE